MKLKGVSLSIETIIVLILAISVMGVLLYYFNSTTGPPINEAKLLADISNKCSDYAMLDPKCNGSFGSLSGERKSDAEKKAAPVKTEVLILCKKFAEVSKKVLYNVCKSEKDDDKYKCLQICCPFCPR